jgi:predicted nucleotidyltransferase
MVSGFFIFVIMKQILEGVIDDIKVLTMFSEGLENRARTMSNELTKIDLLVSSALELRPDIERVARAENFIEDGKLDVRRD